MTRLYVRRTTEGKRSWDGVGWLCEGTYYNRGCGAIDLDETETETEAAAS